MIFVDELAVERSNFRQKKGRDRRGWSRPNHQRRMEREIGFASDDQNISKL